jgi:hypothetical protein
LEHPEAPLHATAAKLDTATVALRHFRLDADFEPTSNQQSEIEATSVHSRSQRWKQHYELDRPLRSTIEEHPLGLLDLRKKHHLECIVEESDLYTRTVQICV